MDFDLSELNPLHLGLAVLSGIIALVIIKFSGMQVSILIKILAAILTPIVTYIYLQATE